MAHDPGADLDQFFAERRERPLFDLFRQSQRAQEVRDFVGERVKLEAHCVVPEGPAGQARPAERVLAFFDPLFRRATAVVELDLALGRPAQVGDDEADAGIQLTLVPLIDADAAKLPPLAA